MKTCKLHFSLVYQSVSQCIAACHLKCKPVNISQRQSILRNILGDRLLYPRLLTDTPGTSVGDRSSYTLIVADWYSSISIHSKCIPQVTDWYIRVQCSGRTSYTLLLIDIRVYTSSNRPLYPGFLADIPGNRQCSWHWSLYTLSLTDIPVYRYTGISVSNN